MKTMKRVVCVVITCCMLFSMLSISGYAFDDDQNAESVVDISVAYNWAKDAGFPIDFLNSIDNELLLAIYKENAYEDSISVSADHRQMEVTGIPDASSSIMPVGALSESTLDFWMIASTVASNGILKKVNVYVYFEWLKAPTLALTDAIYVNWDGNVFKYKDSTFSEQLKSKQYGSFYSSTSFSKTAQGGIGWYCPLTGYKDVNGSCRFTLEPRDSKLASGTRYKSSIGAHYGHRTISVSGISFSMSGGEIQFSGGEVSEIATTATVQYGK